ncbi:MAG TPA: MATE family efflux transporter [Paracoccaceae bacterium]|nr:MATE family efflux transporter [Paracoccaceae bacterium]
MADTPPPPAPPAGRFTEGNLFAHVAVMSLTASVGLMAIFAVDFVDMVFISWLGQAELAAAVGYAGAILFFTTSVGIGMSIAAGALVARAVGARDPALARRRATHALVHGVLFGAAFAGVVWLSLGPLVRLLGASGATEAHAVHYLSIIVPSQPFLMLGMIGGAILRSHGDARRAMTATIWGGAVNAVLDPILIFGLGLDLTGAALASVAARLTIAALALRPLLRHYGGLDRPTAAGLRDDLRPVWAIAGPAMLTQVATPFGQAWVTRAMAAFGEGAVAGMAIAGRLTPLAFGTIFALSGAVGPIIGQNLGAGRMDRVRAAFGAALAFTALVTVAAAAVLFLLRAPIADLFRAQGLARDLVFLFCGPLALMFFFNGAIFVANAACNNLGRPFQSTLVNWGRHTLGTVPFVMAGAAWMGAQGVLVGQAAGGVLFAAIAIWQARRAMRG